MLVEHVQDQGSSSLLKTIESQKNLAQLISAHNLGGSVLLVDLRLGKQVVRVNAGISSIAERHCGQGNVSILLLW